MKRLRRFVMRYLPRSVRNRILQVSGRDVRGDVLRAVPKGSVGAELGVWKGDFSSRILEIVQPARLHLIDPWHFFEDSEYSDAMYGGAVAGSQADMDAIHDDVVQRFAAEIQREQVVIHRGQSADVAPEFEPAYFDWVYIDANHLYAHVKADIELFVDRVKPGGYVLGDDYGEGGWWDGGVKRAVDEAIQSGVVELEWIRDSQFVLRRPGP